MAKIGRQVGTTSQIVMVFIQDSSSTTGAGLTGLLYNSSGLIAYYKRSAGTASTAITLATITTLGTFTSGGFKAVDGTNMPGVYELHIPNAALASGSDSVVIMLSGATNMAPLLLEIELTATSNQDGVRGGMTALPNGPSMIKKNQALASFPFPMFDTTGAPRTGLTVTSQRSIDGGSFASCTNSAAEIGNGWYKIAFAAADLNGDSIALRFSAVGVQDTDVTIVTQP